MRRILEDVDEKTAFRKICVEKVGKWQGKMEFEHESVDDCVESV